MNLELATACAESQSSFTDPQKLSDAQLLSRLFDLPHYQAKEGQYSLDAQLQRLALDPKLQQKIADFRELAIRYMTAALDSHPIETPKQVYQHLQRLVVAKQKMFHVLYLDREKRIITEETITIGTKINFIIHSREMLAPAIFHRANALICAINEPDLPFQTDQQFITTIKRLYDSARIVGIPMLDCVLIGKGAYCSLEAEGMLHF